MYFTRTKKMSDADAATITRIVLEAPRDAWFSCDGRVAYLKCFDEFDEPVFETLGGDEIFCRECLPPPGSLELSAEYFHICA